MSAGLGLRNYGSNLAETNNNVREVRSLISGIYKKLIELNQRLMRLMLSNAKQTNSMAP